MASISQHQQQIGWEQVMQGRLAQESGHQLRTQVGSDTRQTSSTDVFDFIFTQWWHLREQDLETKHQAVACQVDWELQLFYDDYENLTPQHL